MPSLKRFGPALAGFVLLIGLLPSPAQAYANAFFPTQSLNNRGADTLAIQYLLQANGQTNPTDGVFGASTVTAAKAFQTAKGLGVDGIVGPATWTALVPTIRSGDSGPAVKALQVELNAKRRLNLAVDGVFSTAVRDAVVAFQNHAGIGADGIVGPITWRNLAWHYDYPDFTANLCDQDPDGNGTAANWAAAAAVAQLEAATRSFASTNQGQVGYGDAGFEHGGDIPGHASHEQRHGHRHLADPHRQRPVHRRPDHLGVVDLRPGSDPPTGPSGPGSSPRAREVHLVQRPHPDQRGPDRELAGATTTTCTSGTARRCTPTRPTSC